jgi:hypothetical protein
MAPLPDLLESCLHQHGRITITLAGPDLMYPAVFDREAAVVYYNPAAGVPLEDAATAALDVGLPPERRLVAMDGGGAVAERQADWRPALHLATGA